MKKQIAAGVAILFFVIFALAAMHEWRNIVRQEVNSWTEDQIADCAVVLTGGYYRIREGIDLLARKSVQKVIISGVNPQAELLGIFPQWPFYGDMREQDVILEKRSRSTFGNAQQSLPLVEALHCRDVILITSRIHMYRALKTFQSEFPAKVKIYPRAIVAGNVEPPWGEVCLEVIKSIFYSILFY